MSGAAQSTHENMSRHTKRSYHKFAHFHVKFLTRAIECALVKNRCTCSKDIKARGGRVGAEVKSLTSNFSVSPLDFTSTRVFFSHTFLTSLPSSLKKNIFFDHFSRVHSTFLNFVFLWLFLASLLTSLLKHFFLPTFPDSTSLLPPSPPLLP